MARFSAIPNFCKAHRRLVIAAGAVLLLLGGALAAWHFLVEPETVIVRRKKAPKMTLEKAQELYDAGHYEESLDFCVKNRKYFKEDPQFWNFYGVVLRTIAYLDMNSDSREEEIAAFEKALSLAPDFNAARLNLANTFWDTKRIDEAVAQYHKVLQRDPDHPDQGGIMARLREEQRLRMVRETAPKPAPREKPAPMEPEPEMNPEMQPVMVPAMQPVPEPQPSQMNPR